MVIDKTSQCGTERWAVTGTRQCCAEAGRAPGFLSQPCGRRATLTHKQMEVAWKGKGRLLKYQKKKRWRQEESEKKMMSEPLGKAGDPGEYKCANSSEMPLNVCTVIQMSGCFYHHCVFTHRAGCQPHSLGDSNTKARAWDALVPGPSLLRRDIHWYSI